MFEKNRVHPVLFRLSIDKARLVIKYPISRLLSIYKRL